MTQHTGMWVARDSGGNGTTARGSRLATGGLLAGGGGDPLNVRTGVLFDGGGPVVTGTTGMSYSIRPHVATAKVSNLNGPTVVPLDASITVSTDPAPGSNSRIDVIWVRQHHVTGDGGSDSDTQSEYGVTRGSTSAVPSKPAIPAGATELASVPVTAGTTATSGLTFTPGAWTVANGAPIPVRSEAERNALTGYAGLQVMRLDLGGVVETHNGTIWSGGAWSTWSFSGSNFGAGITFSGSYRQAGKTVTARFRLTTSVNGLTGSATLALPVAPSAAYTEAETAVGTCFLRDASAGSPSRTGGTVVISGASVFFVADRVAPGTVGASIPWAWADGDTIAGTITYEAA